MCFFFYPLILTVDFQLTIVVNDDVSSLLRGHFRMDRIFVFQCFDPHVAVHMPVLLHVGASLPRFSRRFDAVTNEYELPFLLR